MPLYMDRHDLEAVTPEDAAKAHVADVAIQEQYGVRYLTYWFDYARQAAFCLAEAPDAEMLNTVHRASHGLIAHEIIEVDQGNVARFMGPIVDHPLGTPIDEPAFRTVLFTDIEGSTSLTQRLGDRGAMEVVRAHDAIVREALALHGGTEVKHTGDGLMASFTTVGAGVAAAVEIQRRLEDHNRTADEPFNVRIGLAAGEPVSEHGDLFGMTVQLAARLCARARTGGVLVPADVREQADDGKLSFKSRGLIALKGFAEKIRAFDVIWQGRG